MGGKLRPYEAVLILKPDAEEKLISGFQTKFRKLLKEGKAVRIETIEDDVRDLAHDISKHPRARFWRVGFEAESGLVDRIREAICHDEILLRQVYLHSTVDSTADASTEKASGADEEPEIQSEEKTDNKVTDANEEVKDAEEDTEKEDAKKEDTDKKGTEDVEAKESEEVSEEASEEAAAESVEETAEETKKEKDKQKDSG
ncbi:hypothetical protein GF359_00070 [candidate division WOR-3 bacterium]|uniref:Small ribosomal subunit protein bS6 n=1 Tax=candidate division WOR-3 bacterium TaxID=2052148 RepID=A0A9D5K7N7_UNCW3|nr:hypothetical protein [candidate division WOR-3 bacterium]MBD3363590.1 hypothetical protein [candidate division WOR-3 bacterium]